MKLILTILLISILVMFVIRPFTAIASGNTEQQKYRVVRAFKDFEIRFYPSATLATISSDAKNYKELSGPGFRKLAGYIFGGNESNTKISMTAPVHMDVNDSESSMSFVMPSGYTKNNLPAPDDPAVKITQTSDEYVAAIRFGGYASDSDLKSWSEKLHGLLKENGITPLGNFRFLGYNPPYQFAGRRNEIIVKVDWKENSR
ncbi:MAG: heme-binding protein [Bacteroidales bacterium]|jgi:hypothetical protein|nr:heme-binding protein [Bacteroidales bacterium]MCU0408932.1 heme-binding protein [Bacteroidales bacterium]